MSDRRLSPPLSPSGTKFQRKMFPDQNIHYLRNYEVGYQGIQPIKATEYKNRFKYDQAKARMSVEMGSPRYKRGSTILPEGFRNDNIRKLETLPSDIPSLPSQDRRIGYSESIPPTDEPQILEADPRPEEKEIAEEDIGRSYEPPASVEPKHYPLGAYNKEKVYEEVPLEFKEPLVQSSQEYDMEKKADEIPYSRGQMQSYKEELDRQILARKQKQNYEESIKLEEIKRTKDMLEQQQIQDKASKDQERKRQQMMKQQYDDQIREKFDYRYRDGYRPGVHGSLPPTSHREVNEVEESAIMARRKKALEEIERLEAAKNSLLGRQIANPLLSRPPETMGFLQDVNRQRFKQKIDEANRKQEAIYRDYLSKMFPDSSRTAAPPSDNAIRSVLDQQLAQKNHNRLLLQQTKDQEKRLMEKAVTRENEDKIQSAETKRRHQQEYWQALKNQQKEKSLISESLSARPVEVEPVFMDQIFKREEKRASQATNSRNPQGQYSSIQPTNVSISLTPNFDYSRDSRKERAILSMQAGVDLTRANPIINPIPAKSNPYINREVVHSSALRGAGLSALHK